MKSLKDVKPGDKIFVLNSNRGYLKEPQIEILTANKVGILYIYTDYDKYKKSNGEAVESSLDVKAFATLEEAETGLFMIKARKYYRNSIKVDDITYSQMKAIFDILGIDTEEVIKMIEYGRFFTKLYRIRRGYYRRNITIRLSVGYEYRLKNKEIFKEVFVSLRGRNIATFKFREQIK